MRDAEIERLLGGYATNTLTDSERRALYQAALEDQNLFNALQDEEAFRELLNDPGSRRMIEAALRQPIDQPRQHWFAQGWLARPWFTERWFWGAATGAVAAGLLVFALLPSKTPPRAVTDVAIRSRDTQAAPPPPLSKPNPAPAELSKSGRSPRRPGVPVAPQPATLEPPRQQTAEVQQARPPGRMIEPVQVVGPVPPASVPAGFLPGAVAGYAAAPINVSAARFSSIPYSVLKRAPDGSFTPLPRGEDLQAGDEVRLVLHPPVSGFLTLQQEVPRGQWNNIFPAASAGWPVTANQEIVVPDSAIQVNGPQQLRLILTTVPPAAALELRNAAKTALAEPKGRLDEKKGAADESAGSQSQTVVTDLTLAPGKASVRK